MNQPVPEELISAYFDGEVTPDERGQVEQLLEASPDLRQQLDDTSKLSALLHSFPREAAPEGLAQGVQKRLDGIAQEAPILSHSAMPMALTRKSLRREWTAFGAGMAATMASLLLIVTLNRSQTTSRNLMRVDSVRPHAERQLSESLALQKPSKNKVSAQHHSPMVTAELDADVFGENADSVDKSPDSPAQRSKAENTTWSTHFSVATPNGVDTQFGVNAQKDVASGQHPDESFSTNVSLLANGFPLQSSSDPGDFQPPSLEELFRSVNDGEVIRKNTLDPNNNVVVVEFTVVDVDRFVDDMRFLLQKRAVPQVVNGDLIANSERRSFNGHRDASLKKDDKLKKSAASDGLVVFFVRASGPELSQTLSESIKTSDGNYLGLAPQLPIELRTNIAANFSEAPESEKLAANSTEPSSDLNGVWNDQPVAVEAKLAVENYASVNHLALDSLSNTERGTKENVPDPDSDTSANKVNPLATTPAPTIKGDEAKRSVALSLPQMVRADSTLPSADNGITSPGYATFHLALNDGHSVSQQHVTQQQIGKQQMGQQRAASQGQSPATGRQGPQQTGQLNFNNPIPFNGNSMQYSNNSVALNNNSLARTRSLRGNSDNRMVRMLIVLKPEQTAAAPAP